MYTKQEAAALKQSFWTAFGQYMSLHLSAEGEKANWINYKTGEKNIYFRMNADNRTASIGIEIAHPSSDIQHLYFEQFEQLKAVLHETLGEEWTWQKDVRDETGRQVCRIYTFTEGINIFKKDDWPAIISFLKPRIIALDEFWISAKYVFETLR
ncbi:DUF4268 domain-containing protein [Pinibacter aurantiacus]|uniref:DUF4268 domain-containing protein n=1 Tax=Pinibacter aurantiacus TaxID=2851599 RepID=A0A9E2S5T7_9BACT|nr:DUF4268 domain-containing protein [Pinibacter aurantiacus]MBV4357188.1 DUF4268 domain-containing protein [Pinibacter aurantiacus]